MSWAPATRLLPGVAFPRGLCPLLTRGVVGSPQTPSDHRLLGPRQGQEATRPERERPSVQRLRDTLQALEEYLRPLLSLLSCPEPRCLSGLFLQRCGGSSEPLCGGATGWGRRREGQAAFLRYCSRGRESRMIPHADELLPALKWGLRRPLHLQSATLSCVSSGRSLLPGPTFLTPRLSPVPSGLASGEGEAAPPC